MKRLMRHRNKLTHSLAYENLEKRALLAGMVYVDLVGPDLIVVGNYQDNTFSVNLTATTTETLIQGQDQTGIRYSDDFDQGFDFSALRNIRIYSEVGDDVVTIFGADSFAVNNLTVSLGHGNDTLYVVGGAYMGDAHVFGGSGHDSIAFLNTIIGDDLAIYANEGRDAIMLEGISVNDQTRILGQYGHDTALVNNSTFGDGVYVEMGQGSDRYESTGSTYMEVVSVRGRQGNDWTMLNESNDVVRKHLHTVERKPTAPNANGQAGESFDQIKTAFFEHGSLLSTEIGDSIQNRLMKTATAFDVALISLDLDAASQTVAVTDPTPTVSVLWDRVVQEAVEATGPGPTIASRAYAMLHTATYDAWSAYDRQAMSTVLGDDLQRPDAENTESNKVKAMSFAAYRVLDDLFATQTGLFDSLMDQLGFDPSDTSTDPTTPAGIGNRMAFELLEFRHSDGSNQLGDSPTGAPGVAYSDTTDYEPVNPAGDPTRIDLWTPEYVPVDATPGTENRIQSFLTPHWGTVKPFGLSTPDQFLPDAPEPFLLVDGVVDLDAKTITLNDDSVVDIDASLIGTVINPAFIAQAENVVESSVNLTDKQKLIAEFWEDGGGTSFPPGTFMTFGEFVSARDNNSIDDDAKMFFSLGNAVFDAGVATWECKVEYGYVRPVRAIRELGELGLIGEFDAGLGGYVIDAWTPEVGKQTILATDFLTYQTPRGDVSPPFAEYTSGHSAFSAAGATILERFTGSATFGGSVTIAAGESRFEPGVTPAMATTLKWDTFRAAADEAGFSRIYGGIHFNGGDISGRQLGKLVGQSVWDRAQFFIGGGVS